MSEDEKILVANLAALVRKLCYRIRRVNTAASPDYEFTKRALTFLYDNGLHGTILREDKDGLC